MRKMGAKRYNMLMAAMLPVVLLVGAAGVAAPIAAQPEVFRDAAFESVWTRTDLLVKNGTVKRSYYWGPQPGFGTYEDYAEGLGGKRLVQYFDKSRMEINDPNANRSDPFYVTNGLLSVELI